MISCLSDQSSTGTLEVGYILGKGLSGFGNLAEFASLHVYTHSSQPIHLLMSINVARAPCFGEAASVALAMPDDAATVPAAASEDLINSLLENLVVIVVSTSVRLTRFHFKLLKCHVLKAIGLDIF